jgi:NAD+ synthase (glutamine-hydrolysing)
MNDRNNNQGYVRVGAAVPQVEVGNPLANVKEMLKLAKQAHKEGAQLVIYPELCLTGYSCGDLFNQTFLHEKVAEALGTFVGETAEYGAIYAVGMPLIVGSQLFNVAVLVGNGRILAVVPKSHIPSYKEFYEGRWFQPAKALKEKIVRLFENRIESKDVPIGTDIVIDVPNVPGFCIGVDICEDIWMPSPPSARHALHDATVLVNLSASNELVAKSDYRHLLIASQSGRCIAAQIYVSCGPMESTADVVFGGDAMIYVNGTKVAVSKKLSFEPQLIVTDVDIDALTRERRITGSFGAAVAEETTPYRHVECNVGDLDVAKSFKRQIDPHPFVPKDPATLDARCEEIFGIQVAGLVGRLKSVFKGKNPEIYIGISGGLDSTLALLVAIRTFRTMGWDLSGIKAVTMPGPGTTPRTLENAKALCEHVGIPIITVPITEAVTNHLRDIGHEPCWNCLKCENAQARERTQILMDYGFTIGTGDLSEIALGWCTYNGDQNSMYNPNCSIPKTLVRHIVGWSANQELPEVRDILRDILATPVSPELKKVQADGTNAQETEKELGPYELHDFFLFQMMRNGFSPAKILFLAEQAFVGTYDRKTILKVLRTFYSRFFAAQFKRDAAPNGPKVGSVSLSQRGDWRMPSDITGRAWIAEVERLASDNK